MLNLQEIPMLEVLHQNIASAGVPVIGVADLGPGSNPRFRVDLDGTGTPGQQSQANQIAGLFDTSQVALNGYQVSQPRVDGQAYLTTSYVGPNNAFRGFVLALVDELNAMIGTINQLVAYANAHGASISTLTTLTKANVVGAIQSKISSGAADS